MGLTRVRWCCAGYWSRLDMNTCQTSIKDRYIIIVLLKPTSWVLPDNTRSPHGSQETDQGEQVYRINTDLPNMYRNYHVSYSPEYYTNLSAFRNCLLSTSLIPKFIRFVNRQTYIISDHFLSSLRDIIQTSNIKICFIATRSVSISQRECIFHNYSVGIITATVTY